MPSSFEILDTPGPPINFVFEDIRKNSVLCKWEPPLDDGGSEIINYVLEKKDKAKPDSEWIIITSTLRHCKYSVTKLIEGKEYLFRVRAENRFGPGPPCVSKPLTAKDPFGKVPLASKFCLLIKCTAVYIVTAFEFECLYHTWELIQVCYFFFIRTTRCTG